MDNLIWGLEMTVLGMGLVFGLLALAYAVADVTYRMQMR